MNVRGIFPSLGAGGSLIAAVLCAAAVFGGALAFRGGGSGAAEANAGDVTVPSRTVRAQTSSSGLVRTVVSLATVGRDVASRNTARPRARRRIRVRTGTQPTAISPTAVTPNRQPAAPVPDTAAKPGGGTDSPSVTEQVTGTAQRTVEQVRQVAQPVIDQVPQPAQQHANSVTDTVDQVAGTVDDTVDAATGGLLP